MNAGRNSQGRYRWRLHVFELVRRTGCRSGSLGAPARRVAVFAPWAEAAFAGAGQLQDELAMQKRPSLSDVIGSRRRQGPEELADFYQTLGAALASGRSLRDSLAMVSRQSLSPRMRGLSGALSCLVSRGEELHEAMALFPGDFAHAHRALVQACSHAGLDQTGALLVRLSKRVRSDGRLGHKISAAMAYPVFLLFMSMAAAVILELKALPPMVELFSSMGARLPLITRLFYDSSRLMVDHAVLSCGLVLGISLFGIIFLPRIVRKGSERAFALRLWTIGPVLQARALVRSMSLFALLKASGVRNSEIFELSAQASGNEAIARFFRDAYRRVASGEGLEEAFLAERHRLGDAGIRLAGKVELGMQTGELPVLLEALASELEERADFQAALLPRVIEIPMLLLCALLVGSIMLAMFLPYPSLLGDIAHQMRPGT